MKQKKSKNNLLSNQKNMTRINEQIINILTKLKEAMYMKKKRFSAIGYDKSIEKKIKYNNDILSLDDISHLFKPDSSTMKHLKEYFIASSYTT